MVNYDEISFNNLYIESFDGKKLCTYISKNENARKAIIICHGMAEHIERYELFAQKLVENGFLVIGYNQRGHYLTDDKENYGYMGETDNFEILINDLDFLVDYVTKKYKVPVYLFGHSMGSFVLTRYIELYGSKVKGIVLSGSGKNPNGLLRIAITIGKLIKQFKGRKYRSKFMNNLSFGSFNKKFKPNRTDYDWLNTVNEEVDKYINDEWCGGIFTLSYYLDFFKGCIMITNYINAIPSNLPILMVSGEKDPVGDMGKSTTKLYESIKRTNKKVILKLYENARHEILLEKNKDEIHKDIIDWLLLN